MSLHVTCAVCGKTFSVPDTAVGTAGRCPHCGDLLKIRGTASEPVKPPAQPPPRPQPDKASVTREPTRIPHYSGLAIAAAILRILALFYYIGATIVIVFAVILLMAPAPARSGPLMLLWGLGAVTAAAFIHALADGCGALRDIARNSWHKGAAH